MSIYFIMVIRWWQKDTITLQVGLSLLKIPRAKSMIGTEIVLKIVFKNYFLIFCKIKVYL